MRIARRGHVTGRVVVLVDRPAGRWRRLWTPGWVWVDVSALRDAGLRLGPLRLVRDRRRTDPARRAETWAAVGPHVPVGGRYVFRRRRGEPVAGFAGAAVRSGRRRVEVTQRRRHALVVREPEVEAVVGSRPGPVAVTVVAARPGGRLRSPLVETLGDGPELPADFAYPEVRLRHYTGPLDLRRNGVVAADGLVLPDSFRWPHAVEPTNRRLPRGDGRAVPVRWAEPARVLPGSHYFLDYENAGHYGHWMTEGLAKLWGWEAAKRADPTLRLVLRDRGRRLDREGRRPETTFLAAYGVAPADVVWVRGPARVRSLYAASPMWHNAEPYSAHPDLAAVWARLRAGLVRADPRSDRPERIFVTRDRDRGHRICRNVAEVERQFAAAGFAVVHPGRLPPAEQARTFAAARVVAGFAGTGMSNLAFADRVEHVVVLTHTGYDARNEYLFAAVHGAAVHYLWSPPDPVAVGRPEALRHASWRCDLERLGPPLQARLRELGS